MVKLNYGKYDVFLQVVMAALLLLVMAVCVYPLLYVLSASISSPRRLAYETVYLLPRGFSTLGYSEIFKHAVFWRSYRNTVFYTFAGTAINLVMTILTAYPLSRHEFSGGRPIMMLITFTMLFSGGMIPMFLVIIRLGIYNTIWAMLLPGAISAMNLIIARTFFQSISPSLIEAAKLDGANDMQILTRVVLPTSQAIIAVLVIYYAVGHWNSYMNALMYLPDQKLQTLQVFLVSVIINDTDIAGGMDTMERGVATERTFLANQMKYVAIVVAIAPLMLAYPIFQKHFTKGVMIGSVKG